jgi:dipeptidase E
MRLLLLSNSRDPEKRYLHHAREPLADALGGRRVLFVPFAGVVAPWGDYTALVRTALAPIGITIDGLHEAGDGDAMAAALRGAEGIVVGGGNTFHLLKVLQEHRLLDVIRECAQAGVPYVGWSAGSVIASPTIRTTNDMPIVEPPHGLGALGLVPFQINAHFTDAHPPDFQGETRRERLTEFLLANPTSAVVGLPEGDWLDVRDTVVTLRGAHSAVLFRAGLPPTDLAVDQPIAS